MFLIAALLLTIIVAAGLWWVRPQAVDMSAYAPADSLVYLEANNPTDIVATLANTDAWKLVDELTGSDRETKRNEWAYDVREVDWHRSHRFGNCYARTACRGRD